LLIQIRFVPFYGKDKEKVEERNIIERSTSEAIPASVVEEEEEEEKVAIERSVSEAIPVSSMVEAEEEKERLQAASSSDAIPPSRVGESATAEPSADISPAADADADAAMEPPAATTSTDPAEPSWIANPTAADAGDTTAEDTTAAVPAGFTTSGNPLAAAAEAGGIADADSSSGGEGALGPVTESYHLADATARKGPGPVTESYLVADAVRDEEPPYIYESSSESEQEETRSEHSELESESELELAEECHRKRGRVWDHDLRGDEENAPWAEHSHRQRTASSSSFYSIYGAGPVTEGFFLHSHYDEQMRDAFNAVPGSGVDAPLGHGSLTMNRAITNGPDRPASPDGPVDSIPHSPGWIDSAGSENMMAASPRPTPITRHQRQRDVPGGLNDMPSISGFGVGQRLFHAFDNIRGRAGTPECHAIIYMDDWVLSIEPCCVKVMASPS
jgi:hypothetical protein